MGILKYAIIGSGTMGKEHIQNINLIEHSEVVAICDTFQPSLEESLKILKKNTPTFLNHNDLIKADLADVYIIATPNFNHINILTQGVISF